MISNNRKAPLAYAVGQYTGKDGNTFAYTTLGKVRVRARARARARGSKALTLTLTRTLTRARALALTLTRSTARWWYCGSRCMARSSRRTRRTAGTARRVTLTLTRTLPLPLTWDRKTGTHTRFLILALTLCLPYISPRSPLHLAGTHECFDADYAYGCWAIVTPPWTARDYPLTL